MTAGRELLEAAAKAAGIVGKYDDIAGEAGIIVMRGFGSRVWTGKVWNPLTDDGDAFRLAVKLKLDVDCAGGEVVVAYEQITHAHAAERVGDDPLAATRRAIVMAAAEIGRSKT